MSNPPPKEVTGDKPLTLEIADKWLSWLEDVATAERDLGSASRLVLFNLVGELARNGVIDGHRLIANLEATLPKLESQAEKIGLRVVIADLLEQLPLPTPAASADESLH